MAWFLFNLGYPYDVQVRDSDGDPVTPPVEVLDLLIEEWRLHEVLPDTDETRDDYRASFAIEIGRDPWEPAPAGTATAVAASSPSTSTSSTSGEPSMSGNRENVIALAMWAGLGIVMVLVALGTYSIVGSLAR